jgi:hypothetical protein
LSERRPALERAAVPQHLYPYEQVTCWVFVIIWAIPPTVVLSLVVVNRMCFYAKDEALQVPHRFTGSLSGVTP